MPASKAQQKAVIKYMKAHYDEIKVRVGKGRKESIQVHAQAHGESVNGFIGRAIDETMAHDQEKDKRDQRIAQLAEEHGKSIEEIEEEEFEDVILRILEKKVKGIRELYDNDKQRQSSPVKPASNVINLDDPK